MPTVSDNAVVIRRWDYSETSQIALLFGREFGMLRGLAKGSKRPKSRFSGGFDLLTRGQCVAIVRPGADLATLTEWHIEQVYSGCRRSLIISHIALYMIDLCQHMLSEHDPHPSVFDQLTASLEQLDEIAASGQRSATGPILVRFQLHLLAECGYEPQLARDAQTGRAIAEDTPTLAFSSQHGGVVADTGEHDRWRVRRETVQILQAAQRAQSLQAFDAQSVERANRLLAAHFRELIGRQLTTMTLLFPNLRT